VIEKRIRLAFVIALAGAPFVARAQGVVGRWESVERSPGGVGETIEFRADGTAYQVSAAMGDATYEIKDDWLITSWKDRETGKVSVLANRVELEGLEMLQKDEQGNLVSRLELEKPAGSGPAIAGIWCGEDGPGLTTLTEFTPSGDMFIRLPIRALSGRYWLSGTDQLAVELEGSTRREFEFHVTGDVLTVTPKGGTAKEFHRARTSLLKSAG
jgi:hypothetical protein